MEAWKAARAVWQRILHLRRGRRAPEQDGKRRYDLLLYRGKPHPQGRAQRRKNFNLRLRRVRPRLHHLQRNSVFCAEKLLGGYRRAGKPKRRCRRQVRVRRLGQREGVQRQRHGKHEQLVYREHQPLPLPRVLLRRGDGPVLFADALLRPAGWQVPQP